jgi:hypothetical protein
MTQDRFDNINKAKELVHTIHVNTDANGNILISHAQKVEAMNLVNYFYGSRQFKEAHINCCDTIFKNIAFQLKVIYEQELAKEMAEYQLTEEYINLQNPA